MDTDHGVMFKLGQKVRANEADPEVVKLTNLYLSAEEYDIVAGLPATEVRKSRWQVSHDGIRMVIDEFHGRHRGLLLAEVELAPGEPPRPAPPFAVRDVTSEDRFSGGALARASNDEVEGLLREVRNAD